jgi:PST family polysaccharide transporter
MAAFQPPTLQFSAGSIRSHIISGGILVGTRLCDYAGRMGENVLIDRIFGTTLLGSYTFANQVSRFSTEAVGNVTWTTLTLHSLTATKESIAEMHRKICRLLATLLFPMTALVTALAPQLVAAFLGERWVGLAFLIQFVMPIAAVTTVASQISAVLLAIDRFGIQFWLLIAYWLARLIVICLGWFVGLSWMLVALAIVTVFYVIFLLVLSEKATECALRPLIQELWGPTVSSIAAGLTCGVAVATFTPSATSTFASLCIGLTVFIAIMIMIDRKGISNDIHLLRRMFVHPPPSPLRGMDSNAS